MRTVYIIRHGQTHLNVQDRIRGWKNIPLDEEGFVQARRLGHEMEQQGIRLDGLISSDLLRSEQTAIEVSRWTGFPVLQTTIALRPWNVGDLTGTKGPAAHKVMMKHAEDRPDDEIGGDGESFNQFKYRVLTGTIGLLNSHPGKVLGLVSHSRGERIIHAWAASQFCDRLSVDLKVFGERGEETATATKVEITCQLVIGGDEAAPVRGARQAPDRNWYVNDPERPGKYLQVRKKIA